MFRIELMSWVSARALATSIRTIVFVEEQRVPPEIELDARDPECVHALAWNAQSEAVATGRLLPTELHHGRRIAHVGRMAVLLPWRRCGVGGAILEALVEAARARGDTETALSAQTHALDFYRAHGFVDDGEDFLEAGIVHRAMRRVLSG